MWVTAASLLYLLMACHGMDSPTQDSLTMLMKQCVAVDGYVSPYVLAFSERRPPLRGCESADRAGPAQARFPREVHVLNVLHDVERVDGSPPYVTVNVEPSAATGVHQGPLVLVLVAPSPVTWRVSTQRISNQSRIIFVIQTGSRVEKLTPVRQKIRRQSDLPTATADLLRWVSSKHRAVTSFTEAPHATAYLKKVGASRSGRARCLLTEDFSSPNSVVTYLDPQPTHACSVSKNEAIMTKDIHVIELLPPANSSSPVGPSEVRLDISTTQRSARDRHLLLLLKGHRDVTWKIHVTGMRGDLDIIVQIQNHVNTDEVNPKQTVRQSMEQLDAYSGEQLRRWTINKKGPLVSYTRVAGAHRLNLIIDGPRGRGGVPGAAGAGGDRRGEESRAQDDQHLEAPPGGGGPGGGGGRSNLPVVSRSPFLTRAKTRDALNAAKQVLCTSRSMEVLLRKQILRIHGIRREHLSLLAPECLAAANQTHYILHTELNTCGTDFHVNGASSYVTYANAILVHNVELSDVAEDLGSADLSELKSLLAASSAADHTRVDDEDYTQSDTGTDEIRVDFSCEYSIGAQAQSHIDPEEVNLGTGQPTPPVGDRFFHLAIYKDPEYTRAVNEWPLVTDHDSLVYLQAHMSGDTNLHLNIQSCWIRATKYPEPTEKRQRLIERGCPTTTDVRMVETADNKVRFSFHFREKVLAYVGCKLTVCARNEASRTDGVPMCTPRNCLPVGPVVPAGPSESAAVNVVYTGPLVPPKTRGDGGDMVNRTPQDPEQPDAAETKACQEVIHVEGLDSGTVVGISFAAFIIGVLLTAALWVIHTHTGPYRQANRPRSTETSGESTPSSTAPITIHHIHT